VRGQRDDSDAMNVSYVNTGSLMNASEIYAANVNSTVGIQTQVTTNYFGYKTTAAASGSGFILTADGYIVTNYHVVEDSDKIKVTTYDDTTYDAELIGYDEINDIAVLKIDAKDLVPVIVGDSDKLNVGDDVIAIGNPLGELTFSLTEGVVSAVNRKITIDQKAMNLIQTDCAINSGNSGGALFNSYGEVIGITNAKYSTNIMSNEASIDNVGFAIPLNQVIDTIESIIKDGSIEKSYIGINAYEARMSRSSSATYVVVASVIDGSPAEEAGLKSDDVILAVNGKEISSMTEFMSIIGTVSRGETVKLTVARDNDTIDIDVRVEKRREDALKNDNGNSSSDSQSQSQFPGMWPGSDNDSYRG
jgi:serine protease Do